MFLKNNGNKNGAVPMTQSIQNLKMEYKIGCVLKKELKDHMIIRSMGCTHDSGLRLHKMRVPQGHLYA